jgi:hypothetical protein
VLPPVTPGLLSFFFFRKELGFEVKREEQNNNKKKTRNRERTESELGT